MYSLLFHLIESDEIIALACSYWPFWLRSCNVTTRKWPKKYGRYNLANIVYYKSVSISNQYCDHHSLGWCYYDNDEAKKFDTSLLFAFLTCSLHKSCCLWRSWQQMHREGETSSTDLQTRSRRWMGLFVFLGKDGRLMQMERCLL